MIPTLREFYGLQPTPPADLFQYFVWEILSERALPARRDLAWHALRRLPALTPDAVFRAPARELLDAVGAAGRPPEEKVERIRALVADFKRHRDLLSTDALSRISVLAAARALRRLQQVPRAARERAILFAIGRAVLPLDEEIIRVLGRLRGEPHNRRHQPARRLLMARVPQSLAGYRDAVLYLRHHAQHTCLKVGPHCGVCPLRDSCASVQRRDAAP